MHCVFMDALKAKWAGYEPTDDEPDKKFNDMVHSAIRITAQVFAKLDEKQQMEFIQQAMEHSKVLEGKMPDNVLDKIKELLIKAGVVVTDDRPKGPIKH